MARGTPWVPGRQKSTKHSKSRTTSQTSSTNGSRDSFTVEDDDVPIGLATREHLPIAEKMLHEMDLIGVCFFSNLNNLFLKQKIVTIDAHGQFLRYEDCSYSQFEKAFDDGFSNNFDVLHMDKLLRHETVISIHNHGDVRRFHDLLVKNKTIRSLIDDDDKSWALKSFNNLVCHLIFYHLTYF